MERIKVDIDQGGSIMNLNIYDFLIDIARKVSLDIQYPIGRCVLFDTEDFDPNEMWGGYGNSQP